MVMWRPILGFKEPAKIVNLLVALALLSFLVTIHCGLSRLVSAATEGAATVPP